MKRIFIFAALIFAVNFCGAATNDFFEKGLVAANAGNFSDAAVDFEKSSIPCTILPVMLLEGD